MYLNFEILLELISFVIKKKLQPKKNIMAPLKRNGGLKNKMETHKQKFLLIILKNDLVYFLEFIIICIQVKQNGHRRYNMADNKIKTTHYTQFPSIFTKM